MTEQARLATKALELGIDQLSPDEQASLRALFFKEVRKGAFRHSGSVDEVRTAFLHHVSQGFAPGRYVAVVDFLGHFRAVAAHHAFDDVPLPSLILYAAWAEHWINVLIVMGMLRSGASDTEVEKFFASQPRFNDKISTVHQLAKTERPKKELDGLIQVMKTRNDYLHYTWAGRPERELRRSLQGIGPLVRKAERMIEGLLTFEQKEFDAPFQDLAAELFPAAR